MTAGGVSGGGRCASSVASTSARRDFRSSSSFIRFQQFFFLGLERLDARLSLRIRENQLDLLLDLFQFLIAETREADAVLEQLQRLIERQLFRFQTLDDRLELLERLLEFVGLFAIRIDSARQSPAPSSFRQPCIRGGPS